MDNAHQQTMDRVYRYMKHVYDGTRPLFLAGRRILRDRAAASGAQNILEVGCGTARNLILLARKMPDARFVGIDISREMCAYARRQVARQGLVDRIEIFEGELSDYLALPGAAQDHAPGGLPLGVRPAMFDTVVFSYSLSMIPDWWQVLVLSIDALPDGGQLLIADFGACQSWPSLARWRLYKNLSHFHVAPRPDLTSRLEALDDLSVSEQGLFGGYAVVVAVTVPAGFKPASGATSSQHPAVETGVTPPLPAAHGERAS